jgi:TPP-dependent indolepyruvate ferredoxin oxidoreductase alpha subunit
VSECVCVCVCVCVNACTECVHMPLFAINIKEAINMNKGTTPLKLVSDLFCFFFPGMMPFDSVAINHWVAAGADPQGRFFCFPFVCRVGTVGRLK